MGYTLLSAHSHVFGSVDGVKAGRILVIHTAGANTRDPVLMRRCDGDDVLSQAKNSSAKRFFKKLFSSRVSISP